MNKKFYIIAIPARLNSKRLPEKVMKTIGKKTMVSLVMKQCINIPKISKVFLCTNNESISNEANEYPIDVIFKDGFRHIRSNITIIYFDPKGKKKFTKYCEAWWDYKKDGCLGVEVHTKIQEMKNILFDIYLFNVFIKCL